MHEVGLCKEMLETIDNFKEGKLTKVKVINLKIGIYASLSLEQFKNAFNLLILDKEDYKECVLKIKRAKGIRYCHNCQREYEFSKNDFKCPICKEESYDIRSGTQINIESIEGE